MTRRLTLRLRDMIDAIGDIRALLADKTLTDLQQERFTKAAFERYLEIVSEASRHIPAEMQVEFGAGLPWRQIADLGNQIRHAYHGVLAERLWTIYEDDLGALELAVMAMLKSQEEA
jgi:uncharacterized protein with HEPN domain